jgi:hypothetical protein
MQKLNRNRIPGALLAFVILLAGCTPLSFNPISTATAPPTDAPAVDGEGMPPQIPGVNPRELAQELSSVHQFTCEDLVINEEGYHEWRCRRESPGVTLEVAIFSRTDSELDLVDANVNQSEPLDEQAIASLNFIAGMIPLSDESAGEATAWVTETLPEIEQNDDVRSRLFDDILFRLYGAPETRSLEIGALPPF